MTYPTTKKTLIERISSGDDVSWEEFYARYAGIVRSVGSLKGLSQAECDDLLQEVMLAFFQQSKSFVFDPAKAKFRTYFGRIVRSQIANVYRKRARRLEPAPEGMDESTPDLLLNAALIAEWRAVMLDDAIEQLKQRLNRATFAAFDLYVRHGMPVEEVAALLEVPPGAVYTAKSRAQKTLRKIIAEINAQDAELELPEDGI